MKGRMKAAVLHKPLDLRVEEVDIPPIEANQALIRIKAVGVCGSDIHYYKTGRCGMFVVEEPLILGHECSGTVAEVGDQVRNLSVGDRVVVEPGFPCTKCVHCKSGRYNLCADVRFYGTPPVDGAFAEYAAADAGFVYRMPGKMSFQEGALMEPLAVGTHGAMRAGVISGKMVCVFGAGPVGLLTTQVAKALGASTTLVVDLRDHLLEAALGLGADRAVNASEEDVVEAVDRETGGEGVDVVFEASGSPKALRQAFHLVRRGGTIVQIGVFEEPVFSAKMTDIVDKELSIFGVFRYANVYPTAISLVSRGEVKLKPLITHTFPLGKIEKAMEIAEKKLEGAIKVQITP